MRPTQVRLHLTSFGPFLDVADNPSQRIGEHLEQLFTVCAAGEPLVLVKHTTLEVSMDAVADFFDTNGGPLAAETKTPQDAPSGDVVELLVHLGVHRGARGRIRVELQGVNDLHCPQGDFKGTIVNHRPIIIAASSNGGGGVPAKTFADATSDVGCRAFDSLCTTIPRALIDEAVATCRIEADEPNRFPVSLTTSMDAGRYLCNFCFCRSLFYAATNGDVAAASSDTTPKRRQCASLFVHVLDPSRTGADSSDTDSISPNTSDTTMPLRNPTIASQALCIYNLLQVIAHGLLSS
jgi:hypothetical protein